jgi:hypothetical protein
MGYMAKSEQFAEGLQTGRVWGIWNPKLLPAPGSVAAPFGRFVDRWRKHKSSYITGSNDSACVQGQEISLSKPFRSMSLSERYWISRSFGPCPILALLYAEIIRSHLRRPGAQGLLVRFRAPSGNLRHDDVAIFDRWRARE